VTSIPFGVFGLAVMGQNLARNVASRGVSVAVYNRTAARTHRMLEEHGAEATFAPSYDVPSFVASIARPRAILIMVKAGAPVDEAIAELRPHLAEDDIVIDGGNSYFGDTRRRAAELRHVREVGQPHPRAYAVQQRQIAIDDAVHQLGDDEVANPSHEVVPRRESGAEGRQPR